MLAEKEITLSDHPDVSGQISTPFSPSRSRSFSSRSSFSSSSTSPGPLRRARTNSIRTSFPASASFVRQPLRPPTSSSSLSSSSSIEDEFVPSHPRFSPANARGRRSWQNSIPFGSSQFWGRRWSNVPRLSRDRLMRLRRIQDADDAAPPIYLNDLERRQNERALASDEDGSNGKTEKSPAAFSKASFQNPSGYLARQRFQTVCDRYIYMQHGNFSGIRKLILNGARFESDNLASKVVCEAVMQGDLNACRFLICFSLCDETFEKLNCVCNMMNNQGSPLFFVWKMFYDSGMRARRGENKFLVSKEIIAQYMLFDAIRLPCLLPHGELKQWRRKNIYPIDARWRDIVTMVANCGLFNIDRCVDLREGFARINALSLAIDVGDHQMVKNLIVNCKANVEEKFNRNFRVSREMRGKNVVYNPFSDFGRISSKIVMKIQKRALPNFQILTLKSKFCECSGI
jgi:hypothetical protein